MLAAHLPFKDSVALFLVLDISSAILPAVLPREHALPVHHVVFPLAFVLATIVPLVGALALHSIVDEGALELAPILPLKAPPPVLLPLRVLAFVDGAVRPVLLTLPMMLIVDPITLVIRTVVMEIGALAIRSVILPVAHVYITIAMDDTPEALLLILVKVAVIPGPIRPDLRSFAVAHGAGPLAGILHVALVDGLLACLHDKPVLADELIAELVVPLELGQIFQLLLHDRVLVVRHELAVLAGVVGRAQVLVRVHAQPIKQAHRHETSRVGLNQHDFADVGARVDTRGNVRVPCKKYLVRIVLSIGLLDVERVRQKCRGTDFVCVFTCATTFAVLSHDTTIYLSDN